MFFIDEKQKALADLKLSCCMEDQMRRQHSVSSPSHKPSLGDRPVSTRLWTTPMLTRAEHASPAPITDSYASYLACLLVLNTVMCSQATYVSKDGLDLLILLFMLPQVLELKTRVTMPGSFFIQGFIFIWCEWVFCVYICMYTMHLPGAQESLKSARSPKAGVTVVSCGELSLDLFREQRVPLTAETRLPSPDLLFSYQLGNMEME